VTAILRLLREWLNLNKVERHWDAEVSPAELVFTLRHGLYQVRRVISVAELQSARDPVAVALSHVESAIFLLDQYLAVA
jgi:hypothetical protein